MKSKINFLLSLICLTIIVNSCSCKKEGTTPSPTLPPITQTGANTFGCKVNGKIWVPYWPCAQFVAGATELDYNILPLNSGSVLPIFFFATAGNITNGESFFEFRQNYTLNNHIYGTGNIYDSVLIHFIGSPGGDYMNYTGLPGGTSPRYLQVTKLDTVNNIISGIFSFTLYAANDSVVVTDGRFDFKFGSYSRCTQ